MDQNLLDQYATIKAKANKSPEEVAVMNAIVAMALEFKAAYMPAELVNAIKAFKTAQDALVAKPATA